MKKERFSVEQIVAVLKQAEAGTPVAELIRHVGISQQSFYRWRKQYAGLQTDQVRQLKLLQEENAWLKKLVAELTLDKAMLSHVLQKSGEALPEAACDRSSACNVSHQRAQSVSAGLSKALGLPVSQP